MKRNNISTKKPAFFIMMFFTLSVCTFTSCNSPKDPIEEPVIVKTLNSPANEARIVLSATESMEFEWAKGEPDTDMQVSYELLFDNENGDFAAPILTVASGNEGKELKIALTRNQLNTLARSAGAGQGEEITLKWAVRTKVGNASNLSAEQRKIILIRMSEEEAGLQPDEKLQITGEGSEAGQEFKKIEEANDYSYYELYTKLEANKPYYFYSELNGQQRTFSVGQEGKSFVETTGATPAGATVSKSGIYRIRMDFETSTITMAEIEDVFIRVSMTGSENKFNYVEKGVWEIKNYNVRLSIATWGLEDRYKIIMKVDGQEEDWGKTGTETERPTINQEGYRDMAITESGQWRGNQFKFPVELCDPDALPRFYTDIVLSMTAGKNYTHDFLNHYSGNPKYRNSIFTNFSLPDPDVIRADDGYFYLYATEHSATDPLMKNAPVMRSADLMKWERVGSIFTNATHPQITDKKDARIWAPSVSKVNGKYVIYYSEPGLNYKHAIGVATSDDPKGPFTDHGKLIDSNEQGVELSIDAFLYQEDGKNYLFWGSFREISVIELTADGLKIKPGAVRKKVGGGQYEAAYVHKKDGYYYLIVSTGDFSKGGTYQLVVGRSQNVMGPYVNKAGKDMATVNHELMLKGNNVFSSPGHCSRIITDDIGNDWLLYHAYPNNKNFRCLMLDKVEWKNGWPIVNGDGYPSSQSYDAPVFNR